MKQKICIANPSGNITVLVSSPVEKTEYARVAQRLMTKIDGAEQVGFFADPCFGGDVRLEMMGGEFCGNAMRSAALYYAGKQTLSGESLVRTEISGCDHPLSVFVDPESGTARGEFPLPIKAEWGRFSEKPAFTVWFEGIVHYVFPGGIPELSSESLKEKLRAVTETERVSAAGLMVLEVSSLRMTPVVYVRDTDTLVYESSCASGSAATAVYLSAGKETCRETYLLKEPGGSLAASVTKENGRIEKLEIGGTITFSSEIEI